MKRFTILLLLIFLLPVLGLRAQPYMLTATNYASGFFGVVADENGQPLATGSVIHLIWDSAGDGMDDPSTNGMPSDDDVLIGTCQVGVTGGAPSDGNFILPGTAPDGGGWCYLRAFNAAQPAPGTYYSESLTSYIIPSMDDPVLYGVEFPEAMTRTLGGTPDLTVSLTPQDPPITIPASGGTFAYEAEITNNTQLPIEYDVWIDVVLPSGILYGPLLVRTDLTLPGGAAVTRSLSQSVPGGAPPGLYTFQVHTGEYSTGSIIDEDSFPFEKYGAVGADGLQESLVGWETAGWEGDALLSAPVPEVFFLAPPYPNPFNPRTRFQFGLPEAADVRIDVYNILGSRVTTLVDRKLEAGYHQVIWDAPNVASGLYLVQMKAGGFVHTRKAFLLK